MLCPIMIEKTRGFKSRGLKGDAVVINFPHECLEEHCAWWDDRLKQCAIKSIVTVLRGAK